MESTLLKQEEERIAAELDKMNHTLGAPEVFQPKSIEDLRVEEITRNGYTVIEDGLTKEELDYIRNNKKLEEIYELQLEDIGGEEKLLSIGDQYSVKHLLAYDDFFINLLTNEKVIPVIKKIFGDYFILHWQNAILNFPKVFNPASNWHRDIAYQHFTTSRPISLTALHIIDDFNEETGGTIILPGSHLFEEFPSPTYAKQHGQQVEAKAGTILLFNSWMFHQCGFNRSDKIRRAIAHVYTLPLIKQQISFPNVLGGKFSDDPFLRKLLGYESETAKNTLDYRLERINNRGGDYLKDSKRIRRLRDIDSPDI